jgi:hypothetical protein
MRVREARIRYAAQLPQPGQALLSWQIRGDVSGEHEALYPSFDVAWQTAAILATDARCHNIWIYDGKRLHSWDARARAT